MPLCLGAPADVQADTMYTKADSGDLTKRTLAADDKQAICDIYPLAQDPGFCRQIGESLPADPSGGSNCACSTGPSSRGAIALPVLGLLLALATRRRRRAP